MIKKVTSTVVSIATATLLSSSLLWSQPATASEPFLGQITMFGGNFAPRNWAKCDGQLLAINTNTALFSLIGTTYGGDGQTTFGLPDLRGRVAVHHGNGPGLSPIVIGQTAGAQNVTLQIANMPAHTHPVSGAIIASSATGNSDDPADNALARKPRAKNYTTTAPGVNMVAGSVVGTAASVGSGTSFDNRQPFLGVNYIIALQGVFPPRN